VSSLPIKWPVALISCFAITATALRAQAWLAPFNHQNATAVSTDARLPFTSPNRPTWPSTFNAIHMALIPVGDHRGRVLVWDGGFTLGDAAPFVPNQTFAFQRYSIIDPAPAASLVFRNFFVPTSSKFAEDMFCSGHAWSPFGYLVVAGGTNHVPFDLGAHLVFTFDPRYPNSPFSSAFTAPLYANSPGTQWLQEPVSLLANRYYPTATLTQRFTRPSPFPGGPTSLETMLITGGSKNPQPGAGTQQEWYTYEALQMVDPAMANGQRIFNDVMNGTAQWWGPGNPAAGTPFVDSFTEYPRCHFLSDGQVFMSGDVPQSAQVNHSFAAGSSQPLSASLPWAQRWDTSAGVPAPSSAYRHACSSVLFVRFGWMNDMVIRIGGTTSAGVQNTCEVCLASTPGPWFGAPLAQSFQNAREHANAVILPDGNIFLVGGNNGSTSVMTPELFSWAANAWLPQPNLASPRDYHATAVLLPDGRVFVGGANNRTFDYEIYLPPYLTGAPPPPRPTGLSITNPSSIDPWNTPVLARPGGAATPGFNVGTTGSVTLAKVVLITPGSVTHHSDMHQRYVECDSSLQANGSLNFTAPSESQAPRGYYMLFVLSPTNIPSDAI